MLGDSLPHGAERIMHRYLSGEDSSIGRSNVDDYVIASHSSFAIRHTILLVYSFGNVDGLECLWKYMVLFPLSISRFMQTSFRRAAADCFTRCRSGFRHSVIAISTVVNLAARRKSLILDRLAVLFAARYLVRLNEVSLHQSQGVKLLTKEKA